MTGDISVTDVAPEVEVGPGLLMLAGHQPQEAPSPYAAMVTKLPNAGNAVVEVHKLRDYVLSTEHPRGKHKARVFASTVGLTADDAEELRQAHLSAAVAEEPIPAVEDEYGKRDVLDFMVNTETGTAQVRSGWVVRSGEESRD